MESGHAEGAAIAKLPGLELSRRKPRWSRFFHAALAMSRKCFGFTCPSERHGGLQPLWRVFSDLARDNRTHTSGTRRGETPLPITSTVSTRASPFAAATPSLKRGGTWTREVDYFLRPLPPRPLNVSSGDAGLVQFTKAELYHLRILLERRLRQRQVEFLFPREAQGDSGIFRGVRRREETGMFPVLHILAVGLQYARRRAGLRENFQERLKLQTEGAPNRGLPRGRRC